MKADDIISYSDLVAEEKANLQRGMNYRIGKTYSVFLMSVRKGAPYADSVDGESGVLIYEGHDEAKRANGPDPKSVDQPLLTPNGGWTENGKFFREAVDYKSGLRKQPELIKVYEKISDGIWCYKGFFELIDATLDSSSGRKVFKFRLKPIRKEAFGRIVQIPHARLIPTPVKVVVWRRDGGRCVICGCRQNLHFDHDIPFSKGGSSITPENVRLLCAKCNLSKSDKILSGTVIPWIAASAGSLATAALQKIS